jgi:hypothetical protein
MLLSGGRPLLDPEAFAMLTTPVSADPDWPTYGYGYGLWVGEEDGRRRIWHSGGMLGFTALLITEPEEGLAAVMLLNGQGDRRLTVRFALEAVRAALSGADVPAVGPAPSFRAVAGRDGFVGTYANGSRSVDIQADGDGLVLVHEGGRASLEVAEDVADVFLIDDPVLDRWPLRFGRDAQGVVVEAFLGDDWFVNDRWRGESPEPHPPAWEAYPGLYRRANAWTPTLRVALRKGRLVVEWNDDLEATVEELEPDLDGWFHAGPEPWAPRWMRFEDVVEGRATRVRYNGGTWYRSFEE